MKIIEKHIFSPKLNYDASIAPNINFIIVACSQNHLRSSIASRLDVGAEIIVNEARVTKINDLDLNRRI